MEKLSQKLKAAKSATVSASKSALTAARQADPLAYKLFFHDYNTLLEEKVPDDEEDTVWQTRQRPDSQQNQRPNSVHSDSEDELSLGDNNDYKFGVMGANKDQGDVDDIQFHQSGSGPAKPPRQKNGTASWHKSYSDDDWQGVDISPNSRQASRIYRPSSNSDLENGPVARNTREEHPKTVKDKIISKLLCLEDNGWKAWMTISAIVLLAIFIYVFVILLIVHSM